MGSSSCREPLPRVGFLFGLASMSPGQTTKAPGKGGGMSSFLSVKTPLNPLSLQFLAA